MAVFQAPSAVASAAPGEDHGADIRDCTDLLESSALDALAAVQDPDQAHYLYEQLVQVTRQVQVLALKAERRLGQLLGPARRGKADGQVPEAEKAIRRQARKLAVVPEQRIEEYVLRDHDPVTPIARKLSAPSSPRPRQPVSSERRTEMTNKGEEAGRQLAGEYSGNRAALPLRQEVMDRFGIGVQAAEVARSYARAIWETEERERKFRQQGPAGRPRNASGKSNDKRLRELRAERKSVDAAYLELIDVQYKLSQMCVVLEGIHIADYGLRDVELWKITDIYEDLISLGEWYDRQVMAVTGYLGGFRAAEKIAKLRDTTGRTPEEAETALRLADRLERKLHSNLAAV